MHNVVSLRLAYADEGSFSFSRRVARRRSAFEEALLLSTYAALKDV